MNGRTRIDKLWHALLFGVLVSITMAGGGATAGTRRSSNVDLRDERVAVIKGAFRVNPGGDFNGDGQLDVLVSRGDVAVRPRRGRTWVLFGPVNDSVRLGQLDAGDGFVIEGEGRRDYASQSTGLGDVNGDGLDDIGIGAPGACRAECGGLVYVVFGKTSGSPVLLSAVGEGKPAALGYRIEGSADVGWDVAGAGDVNLDGLADVLVSSPFGGAFYLVHGQATDRTIELASFDDGTQGVSGYRIDAPPADYNIYYAVANTGDVNGDAIPDAALGVIRNGDVAGDAYVVFGKLDPAPVDLSNLGTGGYQMRGPFRRSSAGFVVAGAGDMNGDGLADTLVTAPAVNCCSRGDAYIVFGKRDTLPIQLKELGDGGIHVRGAVMAASLGESAAIIGDANGDGIQDLALGAPRAGLNGRPESGSVYVVYGIDKAGTIRLDRPGYGFRIDGAHGNECKARFNDCIGDFTGKYVHAAGDVDGDGAADVVFAASYAGSGPHSTRGKAYVVLGR